MTLVFQIVRFVIRRGLQKRVEQGRDELTGLGTEKAPQFTPADPAVGAPAERDRAHDGTAGAQESREKGRMAPRIKHFRPPFHPRLPFTEPFKDMTANLESIQIFINSSSLLDAPFINLYLLTHSF